MSPREARISARVPLETAAKAAGVRPQALRRMESRGFRCRQVVEALAPLYGCPDWIFSRPTPPGGGDRTQRACPAREHRDGAGRGIARHLPPPPPPRCAGCEVAGEEACAQGADAA